MIDLNEIKDALSKATKGPWMALPDAVRKGYGPDGWICQMYEEVNNEETLEFDNQEANARLIANAPEWLASLVERVEEMQKTLEDLKLRMQDGHTNGYESETVFWTRCIWEIDQCLKGESK